MPETLKFLFTPVDSGGPRKVENPHAKKSTQLPEVIERLRAQFGEVVTDEKEYAGETTVFVKKSHVVEVCLFLKKELGFTYLADLGGVDRFTEEERFEVFYNLVSIENRKRLRVKVRVEEDDPVVPSVTGVYRAANWNERECWDMSARKEFPVLGIPGSLPLPPREPSGDLTPDPFAARQGKSK
jgi:NADH-quinone oxidoreductase subunit C